MSDTQTSEWVNIAGWLRLKKKKSEALSNPLFVQVLGRLLSYNPETGCFLWKHRPKEMFSSHRNWKRWNTRYEDKPALTTVTERGYLSGTVCGAPVLAHQVAIAISTGNWPESGVDHKNGTHSDNRFENLRAATQAVNARNSRMRSDNTSGCTGVTFHDGSWVARIGVGAGERIVVGRFRSKEEAILARMNKQRELSYSDRHGAAS